jgi:hypothetical protein
MPLSANQPLASYWYVNYGNGTTTGYYAVTRWATGVLKAVGQVVRQNTTPAVGNERCFVCVVAGTTGATEPTWVLTTGAKTTDNTITWMECSGRAGLNGSLTNTIPRSIIGALTVPLGTICKGSSNATTSLFICTTTGITATIEPTWNATTGNNTTDGTAVWTCLGLAGNYTAWQNPVARLASCFALRAYAWDMIYVGDNHAETQASSITLTFGLSPNFVYCVDHLVATPTSANLKNTATITTTGATNITINGNGYINGIVFNVGTGASLTRLQLQQTTGYMTLVNCRFNINGTTALSAINFGNTAVANVGFITLVNCSAWFANAGSIISLNCSTVYWKNSVVLATGSAVPTKLISSINTTQSYGTLIGEGLDFSGHTAGTLIDALNVASKISLIKCRLGASTPVAAALSAGNWEVDLINCDTGTRYYRNEHWNGLGHSLTETTIVRNGGAYNGATPVSWRIITTAFNDWGTPFVCLPIGAYNNIVGSMVTATIEIVNDGVTLTNADIWVEASYYGSASTTLRSFVNNGLITGLSTPVAHAASANAAWVTTGLTTPIKQKLVVTFTPQAIGFVNYRVYLGRINATIFVDPKVT